MCLEFRQIDEGFGGWPYINTKGKREGGKESKTVCGGPPQTVLKLNHGMVHTRPRTQSTVTMVPSVRRSTALAAPTITGLSRVRPTVAVWHSALASSVITAAACRI